MIIKLASSHTFLLQNNERKTITLPRGVRLFYDEKADTYLLLRPAILVGNLLRTEKKPKVLKIDSLATKFGPIEKGVFIEGILTAIAADLGVEENTKGLVSEIREVVGEITKRRKKLSHSTKVHKRRMTRLSKVYKPKMRSSFRSK